MAIFAPARPTATRAGAEVQKAYHVMRNYYGFQAYISPNQAIDLPPGVVHAAAGPQLAPAPQFGSYTQAPGRSQPPASSLKGTPAGLYAQIDARKPPMVALFTPGQRNVNRDWNNLGPGNSSAMNIGGKSAARVRGGPLQRRTKV
jgi:hypothetical protein